MNKPVSNRFRFESLLAENGLCQSWKVFNLQTKRPSFVKTPTPDSELGADRQQSILRTSYLRQSGIKTPRIVSTTSQVIEGAFLFIEYPYLSADRWTPLTESSFARHFDAVFHQMCILVDYLHLLGLVHCDLKLNNFLLCENDATPVLRMIDLDFLSTAEIPPRAMVFGTPEHIAPEITSNDVILPQSDSYSLGVAIRNCQDLLLSETTTERVDSLQEFVKILTDVDPTRRPRFLLDSAYEMGVVSGATYTAAKRALLSMMLLTRFRSKTVIHTTDAGKLRRHLLEENHILGLRDELIDDLTTAYKKNRRRTWQVCKSIVLGAEVEKYGDYWHLTLADDQLREVYGELETIISGKDSGERERSAVNPTEWRGRAQKYEEAGQSQKAILAYQSALSGLDAQSADPEECEPVLKELAEVSWTLNRLDEALDFYRRLYDSRQARGKNDLGTLFKINQLLSALGRFSDALDVVEQGVSAAHDAADRYMELKFLRAKAWRCALQSDYKSAEEILSSLSDSTEKSEFYDLVVLVHYTYAVITWRKGDLKTAVVQLNRGYKLAKKHGLKEETKPIIIVLSYLYSELAEYRRSIQYGKLAVRDASSPIDESRLPSVFVNLMFSCSRIGNHAKAEYWLQRYLNSKVQDISRNSLVHYYLSLGTLKMNSGDLKAAKTALSNALGVARKDLPDRKIGKVYQKLAEIAFYQGESRQCQGYLDSAEELYRLSDHQVSLAEVALLRFLNDVWSEGQVLPTAVLAPLESLVALECRYYASLCLLFILLDSDQALHQQAKTVIKPLQQVIDSAEAPLFAAVSVLLKAKYHRSGETTERLRALKNVYRTFEDAGNRFLALIVSRKIARLYLDDGRQKLARKFLANSLRLAQAVGNRSLATQLESELDSISIEGDGKANLMQSMHGISEILKNIRHYEESLRRLVQFAVDETGAERGALLLKKAQSSDLKVASFINCDEDSLSDIQSISSSIPLKVSEDLHPLIIDNAVADKRTKGLKSIVHHNILSVACIPITSEGNILGTLYLDHHTIAALFEEEDITFMGAIANFIAVMLITIQRYKSINLINQQLIQDLNSRGDKQPFITRDKVMLDLLNRLPEIARTTAPVLIMGESGTGKEILADMIHDLSARSEKPFLKLNCAYNTPNLIESELFGIARRVATDVDERDGKFVAADGGTLMLDEIGDMPKEVQAKVLRVLEYQQFERIGSNRTIHTDIRFIYATNKDLVKMIREGQFREELFFRISTVTIEIPPLRERREDIALLIEHFLRLFTADRYVPGYSAEALQRLIAYNWPGNVRELKNLMERLSIRYPGEKLDVAMLPKEIREAAADDRQSGEVAKSLLLARIREALMQSGWNQSQAARRLGLPLSTLRRRIKKYKITRTN